MLPLSIKTWHKSGKHNNSLGFVSSWLPNINILVSHKKNLKLETWKKQNLKYLSLNRDHVLDIHVCQSQICITIQNDSIRHIYKFSIYISPITWTLKRAHFRS